MSNYDLNLFQEYRKAKQSLEAASFNCQFYFCVIKNKFLYAVIHFKDAGNVHFHILKIGTEMFKTPGLLN